MSDVVDRGPSTMTSSQADAGVHAKAPDDGPVAWLVRELVATCVEDGPGDEQGDIVLLDVEVDGARYLLTRLAYEHPSAASALSPREQEIARMVAQGFTNKAIASVLDISTWTVSTHLRRIFAKLGVSTRAAMVAKVINGGAERAGSRPP